MWCMTCKWGLACIVATVARMEIVEMENGLDLIVNGFGRVCCACGWNWENGGMGMKLVVLILWVIERGSGNGIHWCEIGRVE